MIGKLLKFVAPAAVGALAVLSFPIRLISSGHPEAVPAGGAVAYADAAHAVPDGTGDFDSASRGGGPVQELETMPGEARRSPAA